MPEQPAPHPLAVLTVEEIRAVRALLADAGLVTGSTRFSYVLVREPEKGAVLAYEAGTGPLPAREVGALLTDPAAQTVLETVTCLTTGRVVHQRELDPKTEGWGPLFDDDFPRAEEIVKKDPVWLTALARRGITDVSTVWAAPATPGHFGYEDEVGRRVYRVVAFRREKHGDLFWSNPVPGLVAHVAIDSGKVLRVVETDDFIVPAESGNYFDPAVRGPERTTLKPISITQPEGPTFTWTDGVLEWENWKARIGFNGREALTLHQISFDDRPIVYRASVSEMVVNYGDPNPTTAWINYFDAGEFQFGRLANSLRLGCDCLGEIHYLDVLP